MSQEQEPTPPPEPSGRGEGADRQRFELDAATRQRWIDIARKHFADAFVATLAEARFNQAGLLTVFEESGILPQVNNPNPHDANLSPREHEEWWSRHPNAAEDFDRDLRIRNERLRLLYIGTLFGPHLLRFRNQE